MRVRGDETGRLEENVENTMSEEECDGACDDPNCNQREEYEVEFMVIVKGTVMAHSEAEADELASAVSMDIGADLPDSFSAEWTEDPDFFSVDYSLDSPSMRAVRAAETAKWADATG